MPFLVGGVSCLAHSVKKQYPGLLNISANGLAHCIYLLIGLSYKVSEGRGNQGHVYQGLNRTGQGSKEVYMG